MPDCSLGGGGLDIICAGAMGARRGEAGVASTGLGGVGHKVPEFASGQGMLDRGVTAPCQMDPRSRRDGRRVAGKTIEARC